MPLSKERTIFVPGNNRNNYQLDNHPLYSVDLSFKGEDTQHTTHAIHPYVAAINPPLVAALIDSFVPPNGTILDPFCGGGGVLVESMLKGKNAEGGDINPLAVHISNAKTRYIPKRIIDKYYSFIMNRIGTQEGPNIPVIPSAVKYWFKDYMLSPLVQLKNSLARLSENIDINDDIYKDDIVNLFKVILSATVRDVMLTYRGEVRLRKLQGSDYDRFNPDVIETYKKRAILTMERVSQLPNNVTSMSSILDVKNMPFRNNQFTTIICSPPYGDDKNGVGYFQFSKKMLYFLGYDDTNIKQYKNLFLGELKDNKIVPPSNNLRESLNNVLNRNETHYKEGVAFYNDYYYALIEMCRVVQHRIIIVIGNRVLSRTHFDNPAITIELLDSLGIVLEHHFERTLPKKRIANLGGDGGGGNTEHILVFRK